MVFILMATFSVTTAAAVSQDQGGFVKVEKSKWSNVKERVLKWQKFGFVLNNDTFDEAKALGLSMVDFAIASLESIKNRIEEMNLSMKDMIISEIDSHIAELLSGREKIEQASTVEELREAIREVRLEWRDAKVSLQKAIVIAALDRLEELLERGENIEAFVEEKIAEFSAEGKDTTLLENWLQKFRNDRVTALEKVSEAKYKVMEIQTPAEGFKAMKEVRGAVRSAIEYTKECMRDLKELIRLINEYGDNGDVEELMSVLQEVKGGQE
jgi:hypothetical protein